MPEQHNIEYKQSWRDEYLKWICGFANAQGGKLFIGIDDDGIVVGVDEYGKLMDDIPNKVVNHLGLVADVNLHKKENRHYIEIVVPTSSVPIAYHGIYHYRSGSTKQELKGIALQNLLLRKIGRKWEDMPIEGGTLKDLNEGTIQLFIAKAVEKNRIPSAAGEMRIDVLLKNLDLITEQGQLTNASMLLFGKDLMKVTVTASFKIGRFGKSSHDLLFHDIVETNIFDMADKVMEVLKTKYLIRPISYKGLERLEPLEYPESALREAVLNSIIHKDYSSTYIFLRVYDDRLHLWNPGSLPEELSIDELRKEHSSYPRNKNIANVFFKSGYIESWGRGINKIIDACFEAGLPEPLIEEEQGGFSITFLKDIYTEDFLRRYDLEERHIKVLLFMKANERISNREYQELFNVSKRTASYDLQLLLEKNLILKIGSTGKGTYYVLQRGNKGAKSAAKGQ
ncbi:ATP-binding protein [Chitinophaga arvensicola]|uniref:ATP-dependent DNA helicase RecG n=1 Tax=Chitinophaga arvensicola TaxID=29529 RepID=A0A1I0S8G1_9BACT|nr:ATP-binding protein [Chitinophaga arvensicola]SEW52368.1 ATP-dependent DNA helicase RecG [Chitinophaga arvensicola]